MAFPDFSLLSDSLSTFQPPLTIPLQNVWVGVLLFTGNEELLEWQMVNQVTAKYSNIVLVRAKALFAAVVSLFSLFFLSRQRWMSLISLLLWLSYCFFTLFIKETNENSFNYINQQVLSSRYSNKVQVCLSSPVRAGFLTVLRFPPMFQRCTLGWFINSYFLIGVCVCARGSATVC